MNFCLVSPDSKVQSFSPVQVSEWSTFDLDDDAEAEAEAAPFTGFFCSGFRVYGQDLGINVYLSYLLKRVCTAGILLVTFDAS